MPRSSDKARLSAPAAALAFAALVSACSDIYYDRRETVAFGGGDAVATNRIVQTIDPWPPAAYNRRLTTDGAVAAMAVARYRAGAVLPPRGYGTSSTQYNQQLQQMQQMGPPAPPPPAVIAAPVK